MRITLGRLKSIIREEVMRETVSKYKPGRIEVFPDDFANRSTPSDFNSPDERDFMGADYPPEEEWEEGWDGKIPPSYGRTSQGSNLSQGTYNPDGSRNKIARPKYIPMRGR